jgi:large subunit ribosomal protein L25
MEINDTITLASLSTPATVTLLDDSETVIATLSPPRLQLEADDEIESETEVVGEGEAGEAEAGADAAEGGDAEASGDSDAE